MAAEGVTLNHISRSSSDINHLAKFYQEILGFEQIESPKLEFNINWMSLPPNHVVQIHLIERDPEVNLPESESGSLFGHEPKFLRRGHHACFSVSNFDSFVQTLKEKGIKTHESFQSKYFSLIRMVMVWWLLAVLLRSTDLNAVKA